MGALAKYRLGRVALHLLCIVRGSDWRRHPAGVMREFLSFVPQFTRRERVSVALQSVVSGLIVAAVALAFGPSLALIAGTIRGRVMRDVLSLQPAQRALGAVLIALSMRLALARRASLQTPAQRGVR